MGAVSGYAGGREEWGEGKGWGGKEGVAIGAGVANAAAGGAERACAVAAMSMGPSPKILSSGSLVSFVPNTAR